MADFATLSTKLAVIVRSVTELDDDAVFEYEPNLDTIEKDPFASVTPSANENEFVSTSENRRTYAFVIRMYVERHQRGEAAAERVMRSIVDALIDKLDADYTLTGSALVMLASPSSWLYTVQAKEYRVAEIRVQARTDFDVSA